MTVPGFKWTSPPDQLPGPDLRPGQVLENTDRFVRLLRSFSDRQNSRLVLVNRPVGEVQSGHVHPGFRQGPDLLGAARAWTQGADDLGPPGRDARLLE